MTNRDPNRRLCEAQDLLGRATNVADRLALEAIIMVDQAETEIRRGVA